MGKNNFFADPNEGLDRVDGRAKVTGAAKYSAEYDVDKLAYGVLVESTIAKGKITLVDAKSAERSPGVLAVLWYANAPKIPGYESAENPAKPPTTGQPHRVFYDDKIYFNGQPIVLVVADTYERALHAASLVKVKYEKEKHDTDLDLNRAKAVAPKRGGDYVRGELEAYKKAPIVMEAEYIMPIEVHNPMELHATIAIWNGNKLTVYDKTQGVKSTQRILMEAFKLKEEEVQVNADFVGGGFGSGLRTWPHVIATVMAARKLNRPVKVVLTRPQMFTMVGYRPHAIQKLGLGATADGKLVGITHEATSMTSTYEEFTEGVVNMSRFMYACPNVNTVYKIAPLDMSTPTWKRGPGEATGAFALESAMDEMAYKLGIDPVAFRLANYAETDPQRNLPFSSKYLKEAYQLGSDKIGWQKRNAKPRSMREGDWLVGYGMASGVFNAGRGRASVKAILSLDGTLVVQSAVSDSGPGTATAMTGIAADAMGMQSHQVIFEMGDSSLPPGPTQGGSTTVSTLGSAVYEVCMAIQQKILELSAEKDSSFKDVAIAGVIFKNGRMTLKNDPTRSVEMVDILKQHNMPSLEIIKESQAGDERQKYSIYSFSVHFTKVHVHSLTGVVRVKEAVTVADAGKIINKKTAGNQMIGGVVGGIGMALMEEAVVDHRYGKIVNNNYADYHVAVHADVPHIDALFVDIKDPVINPMGSKGLGEIAIIGYAAAVANAVFHATGKRIRELPITPDKLMA